MPLNAARKWKYWIVAGIVFGLAAAAYTPARQFHRFFMTPCAADGPARETELDIDVQPVDVTHFYDELQEAAAGLPIEQVATAAHAGRDWPIYLIGKPAAPNVATLVIAGVHGNEVSGSLAAHEVLRMMQAMHRCCSSHRRILSASRRVRATTRRDATSIATSLRSARSRHEPSVAQSMPCDRGSSSPCTRVRRTECSSSARRSHRRLCWNA